jgi:hypothetical protein
VFRFERAQSLSVLLLNGFELLPKLLDFLAQGLRVGGLRVSSATSDENEQEQEDRAPVHSRLP